MELQQVLTSILIQLNSNKAECNLFLDRANVLNLKLYNPPKPPAFLLKDYIVPVLLRPERQLQLFDWGLTVNYIVPHIDGHLYIKQISQNPEVDMDMEMVRACLRVLKQYEVIDFVDIFQYSNLYKCTPEAMDVLSRTFLSSPFIPTSSSSSSSISSTTLSQIKHSQLLNEAFEFVCKVAKKDSLFTASTNIPLNDHNATLHAQSSTFSRSSSTGATAPNHGTSYSLPKEYHMNIAMSRNSSTSTSASLSSSAGTANVRSPNSTYQHSNPPLQPTHSQQSPYSHQLLHHPPTHVIPSSLSGRMVVPSSYPPIQSSLIKQPSYLQHHFSSSHQSNSQSHTQDAGPVSNNNVNTTVVGTSSSSTPTTKAFTNLKEKRKNEEYRFLKAALAQLYCACHHNNSFGEIVLSKMTMKDKYNCKRTNNDCDNGNRRSRQNPTIDSNASNQRLYCDSKERKGKSKRNQKKEHEEDDKLKRNSASSSSTHFSQTPPRSEPSNLPEYSSKGCKTALEPILTPDEWREALNFFDHRRFITFGVIRGWIRRVHCFPLAYTSMTYPMAESNTTIVGID